MAGARLSHRGDDCSFETFLKEYELEDPVLREIAEIVHDADLMDEKYGRPESEGLDAIVRGMQLSLPDDETLTATHRRPLRRPLRLPAPGDALAWSGPKIEVRGLRYAVGGTEILNGVDAAVPDGGSHRRRGTFGGGEEHPAARRSTAS